MEEKVLKKKRSTLRSSTTKLLTKIENSLSAGLDDIEELEILLEQLLDKAECLKILNTEIENITILEDIESETTTSDEYQENIILWKVKLTRKIKEFNTKTKLESVNSIQNSGMAGKGFENKTITVKLPRLEIPKFHGNPAMFIEFYSQFENAIHNNSELSKIDKFNYLKGSLTGNAAASISGLSLTNENYDAAICILKDRYGKRDVLINTYMSQFLDIKPVKNSNDLYSLKKLYEKAEIQIRNLNSVGIESKSYGNLLCPILLKLLPPDLTLQLSRENTDDMWNLDKFLMLLQKEISNRERANSLSSETTINIPPARKNERENKYINRNINKYSKSSAHQLLAPASENKCLFCKTEMNHSSELCNVFSIEEKKQLLLKEGRCFLCLRAGKHLARNCKIDKKCDVCQGNHNKTLCFRNNKIKNKIETETIASISQCKSGNKTIFLQTCSAFVKYRKRTNFVRILLDTGSSRSYLSTNLQNEFNFPIIRQECLSVFSFGSEIPFTKTFDVVSVRLENRDNPFMNIDVELLVTDKISAAKIPVPDSNLFKSNKILKNLQIADSGTNCSNDIKILIGIDYYNEIMLGNIKRLNQNFIASETLFGWCLQGVNDSISTCSITMNVFTEEKDISKQIEKFWQVESLGIEPETESTDVVLDEFEKNICYQNKRYTVKLPWKPDLKDSLYDNYEIALERFHKLNLKFRNNPELFFSYKKIIDDYLSQGIIEPVTHIETDQTVFYLPHRAVLREDRITSRLRIVFDASSHAKGKLSLNDCLYIGPNLYSNVFELLLSFREHPVAFVSDIKQAFLQIEIDFSDRDVTRFFWSDDPNNDAQPNIFRFKRVLFGISSSPFLLCATIRHHLSKVSSTYSCTSKLLERSCYVDDVIAGDVDEENAFSTSLECVQIFNEASMQLHKWQTNSKELQNLWENANFAIHDANLEIMPIKVLGISWNTDEDSFYFDSKQLKHFISRPVNSKRFVLQTLGRLFDPVGFYGPYTVRAKCLMQEIWSSNIDWDEKLPRDILLKWEKWYSEIEKLDQVNIPRHYWTGTLIDCKSNIELHCFSDSSLKAYGSVVYLRGLTRAGHFQTIFVASKSRVAPLKSISLPRLELLGALLSARLGSKVAKSLKYNLTLNFWTDSTITYFWVTGSSDRFGQFVKNRINEIQKLTRDATWSHCPGNSNPADLISRGMTVEELKDSDLWWHGPPWLLQPKENWPIHELKTVNREDLEIRKNAIVNSCLSQNSELLQLKKYNSLKRVIRIIAYIKRFIDKTRKITIENQSLSASELQNAEKILIRNVQWNNFSIEIDTLERKKPIEKNSNLFTLAPYLDEDNILRIKGRIEETDYTFDEKHPIIIPKNSKFAVLLIKRSHEKVLQSGAAATLTDLRKNYWIPKGRQLVKKTIRSCLICRKYSAKPATQLTAQLPKERITESPPFTVCGLDFAGPIFIKSEKASAKAYVALFTCATTRAIHLELVSNLSTEKFILAFKRFQSRRGAPKIIYSDNAKTFKRAANELQKIYRVLKNVDFQDFIAAQNITWKFIVERAPWWGGFYERLVKSIKEPLRKILGKALLTFEELTTVLTEIEAVINERPLTFVSDTFEEPSPLTPNHFLRFGKENLELPISLLELENKISTKDSLNKRKNYQARLLKQLWIKWKEQYLLNLRNVNHFKNPQVHDNLKVGDIVLLEGSMKSKLLWDLAIIKELIKGRDGYVRAAIVKTTKANNLRRPIQLLYPLELNNDSI